MPVLSCRNEIYFMQWNSWLIQKTKAIYFTLKKKLCVYSLFFNIWSHVPSSPNSGVEKCQQSREEQIVEMSVCRKKIKTFLLMHFHVSPQKISCWYTNATICNPVAMSLNSWIGFMAMYPCGHVSLPLKHATKKCLCNWNHSLPPPSLLSHYSVKALHIGQH